jgi:hypothetical protein
MAKEGTVIGCTEDEIRLMEEHLNLELPAGYKDWLRVAGKCSGSYGLDVDSHFPEVLELTEQGRRFVSRRENGKLQLPENAVVIARPSYEYLTFFVADGINDNPPIFIYVEEGGLFTKGVDSFWEMIEGELEQCIEARNRYPDSDHWRIADEKAIAKARIARGD